MPIENLEYRKRKMLWSGNYEPTFTSEDCSLFIACAKQTIPLGREVSILITNNNLQIRLLTVEPYGGTDNFAFGSTLELLIWVDPNTDTTKLPPSISIKAEQTILLNFPRLTIQIEKRSAIIYTDFSQPLALFELDGVGTLVHQN